MKSSIAQRQHMVLGQLFTNEILDKRILQAMVDVPRDPFLPPSLQGAAYVDEDLDVGGGRYEMEPLTLARLIDLAQVTPASRVLLIGALSGYAAAIISKLAGQVFATDLDAPRIEEARAHMRRLGISNVTMQHVTLLPEGYSQGAPYDAIIVAGSIHFIPETLGLQLAPGGRIVTVRHISSRPGSRIGLGRILTAQRIDHKMQHREHYDAASAVLPGFERAVGFSF